MAKELNKGHKLQISTDSDYSNISQNDGFERLYTAAKNQQARLQQLREEAVAEAKEAQNTCKVNPYSEVLTNKRKIKLLRGVFKEIDKQDSGVLSQEGLQAWIDDLWELGGLRAESGEPCPEHQTFYGDGGDTIQPLVSPLASPQSRAYRRMSRFTRSHSFRSLRSDRSISARRRTLTTDAIDQDSHLDGISADLFGFDAHEQRSSTGGVLDARDSVATASSVSRGGLESRDSVLTAGLESRGGSSLTTSAHLDGKCHCLDDVTSQVWTELLAGQDDDNEKDGDRHANQGVRFSHFCKLGLLALEEGREESDDSRDPQISPLLGIFFVNSMDLLDYRLELAQEKERQDAEPQYTFQPQLTKRSDKLDPFRKELLDIAVKALSDGEEPMRRVSLWQEKRKEYLARMQQDALDKVDKELDGYTFAPERIAKDRPKKFGKKIEIYDSETHTMEEVHVGDLPVFDRLSMQLYRWGADKRYSMTASEREYEDHCTFSPNLKKSKKTYNLSKQSEIDPYFLFEEHVKRMRAAWQRKLDKEKEDARPTYTNETYKRSRKLSKKGPKPFNLSERYELPETRAVIKVLGKPEGKERTISLRDGDLPSKIANSFARYFNIGQSNEARLLKQITQAMEQCGIRIGSEG